MGRAPYGRAGEEGGVGSELHVERRGAPQDAPAPVSNSIDPEYLRAWGKACTGHGRLRFHRLAYHALDAAAVALELLTRDQHLAQQLASVARLEPGVLARFVTYLVALHDLGKLSPEFQDLRRELVEQEGIDRPPVAHREHHDALGLQLSSTHVVPAGLHEGWLVLELGGQRLIDLDELRTLLGPWLRAVAAHHGVALGRPPQTRAAGDLAEQSVALARDLAALIRPPVLCFRDGLDARRSIAASAWAVSGLTVISDWLSSDQRHFPYCAEVMSLADYWDRAKAQAARAVEESGLLPPVPSRRRSFEALFPQLPEPRPMQRAAQEIALGLGPQLFVIEDVPGSGKTEAAQILVQRLIASGHALGVQVALPRGACASPTGSRWAGFERQLFASAGASAAFAHGHRREPRTWPSEREPRYAPEEDTGATCSADWLSDPRRSSVLSTLGVAPLEQIGLAALPAAYSTVRLFGLMRSVLVFDAVLSHDPSEVRLIEAQLELQAALGGSAIVLSSCLPVDVLQRFVEAFRRGSGGVRPRLANNHYPLLTAVGFDTLAQVSPPVEAARGFAVPLLDQDTKAVDRVICAAMDGESACWVRNTVEDVIDAHRRVSAVLGPEAVTLLHEQLVTADRIEVEAGLLERFGPRSTADDRAGRVVIATRVIDALDVGFDHLVSDLAPIDVLLQRSGRLQRHDSLLPSRYPELAVLAPSWTDAPQPYWFSAQFPYARHAHPDHGQLWLTMRLLRNRGGVLLPEDARWLIESVYDLYAQEEIPHSLWRTSDRIEVAASEATQERMRPVSPWSGYLRVHQGVVPRSCAPGAHGSEMTTFRLARAAGGVLLPLVESPQKQGWEASLVDLPRARAARRLPGDFEREIAIAEPLMPDRGRFAVTVVLTWDPEEAAWRGLVSNEDGKPAELFYDSTLGLRVRMPARPSLVPNPR